MELSKEELKVIKREMRGGKILFFILILFLILFDIIYFNLKNTNVSVLILCNILFVLIGWFIERKINIKFYKDIKSNKKISVIKKLQDKISEPHYDPSYQVLQSNVFSMFFSNFSRKEVLPYQKFTLIIENKKYHLHNDTFDTLKKGDLIEISLTEHSQTVLEIKKIT